MRRPLAKISNLRRSPRGHGLIDSREGTEVDSQPSDVGISHPALSISRNARMSARVVLVQVRAIPAVLRCVTKAQVRSSIVQDIPVLVIDSRSVTRRQSQQQAVKTHAGNARGPHAAFAVVPLDAGDEGNINGIDHCARPIEQNLNQGCFANHRDSRRRIAHTSLTLMGGTRG